MRKLRSKKGFTLMEILIVVAIIAILVAIAIPTMNNALQKAREATDKATIRSVYAECMLDCMLNDKPFPLASDFFKKVGPLESYVQRVDGHSIHFTYSRTDTSQPFTSLTISFEGMVLEVTGVELVQPSDATGTTYPYIYNNHFLEKNP